MIYHGLTYALAEDEWKRVLSSELDSVLGSWEARGTLLNPLLTSDDLFRETVLRDPVGSIELYHAHNDLASLHHRIDDNLLGQLAEAAPNTALNYVLGDLNESQQAIAIAAAETVQISEIAANWEFTPTTKQAKEYDLVRNTGLMWPMSYTVAATEEEIVTVTAAGVETRHTAAVGDVIMSGPSGERYVVKAAKFGGLYDGEVGDTVIPNQSPRMVKEYEGSESVVFVAPWGERMILSPGDYVVSDGPDAFYRIGRHEFQDSYVTPA